MKNFKKMQAIALLLLTVTSFIASAKSPSVNSQLNVNETHAKPAKKSVVQTQLDKAIKEEKAVFLVVTGANVTNVSNALILANNANAKYKNAVVVKLDRDNTINTSLVRKFGLAGVPLPLILVISPKGAPVAGLELNKATVEKIVNAIPSPKEDDILVAINNKKPVFVFVSKKTNSDRAAILANCKAANKQLKGAGVIIEINPTDEKEQNFLKNLSTGGFANASYVFVFNASGQATGTFSGNAETASLVAAAKKVIKRGGCCPGGAPAGGCGSK